MNTLKQFFRISVSVFCLLFLIIPEMFSQTFLKTVWEKDYESNSTGKIFSSIKADDGSWLLVGETNSSGAPGTRILVLKIDSKGTLTWQKTLGSNGDFKFKSVCKSQNEGFYVLGTKQDAQSKKFVWIAKADANGNMLWEGTAGGGENENITDIIETPDFGLFVCGSKEIKGDHDTDGWLIKFSKKGAVETQALFGTRYINDELSSIISDNKGGYILSGFTSIKMGEEKIPYFINVDFRGNKKWVKSFPDLVRTIPVSSYLTNDGSVAILSNVVSGSGGFEKISKLVISTSGELIKNVSINKRLNISKNSYIQLNDDQLIMLSAMQEQTEISSDKYLMRLDNELKPVWMKTLDLDKVALECLARFDNSTFLSAGSVAINGKKNCEALVFSGSLRCRAGKIY